MDKSPDAFRTISEVAGDLDLPQHVLRFWETRFAQIRPLKRGGGRRYYRPDDVELLKGIRHLLYGEGYTIRGVQRILKEQGVRFVMTVWQEGAPQPPRAEPRLVGHDRDHDREAEEAAAAFRDDDEITGAEIDIPFEAVERAEPVFRDGEPRGADVEPFDPRGLEPSFAGGDSEARDAEALARRFAPDVGEGGAVRPRLEPILRPSLPAMASPAPEATARVQPPEASIRPLRPTEADRPAPLVPTIGHGGHGDGQRGALGQIFDRLRPGGGDGPAERGAMVGSAGGGAPRGAMSRDEIRRLQATLFELLECKRLLDQGR